jgi:hypothetical protein
MRRDTSADEALQERTVRWRDWYRGDLEHGSSVVALTNFGDQITRHLAVA